MGNRVDWRKDSGLRAGSYHKVDLVGGYYVNHGYVKFGYPMAASMTLLAWGISEFKRSYMIAEEYTNGLAAVKWGADYFIKCFTDEFEFYGQVWKTTDLNDYWGRPEDIDEEVDTVSFKCTHKKPCTDLLAETSAALAATGVIFKEKDAVFARKCIQKAIGLYKFANKFRGSYHKSIPDAINGYQSYNGFDDELAWSALWLFKATKSKVWISKASEHMKQMNKKTKIKYFNWDDKRAAVDLMFATVTNSTAHWTKTRKFCDWLAPGGGAEYTPRGLLFLTEWGTLGDTSNSVLLCLIAASRGIRPNVYRLLAKKQLFYMLGENTGQSFVVGYGKTGGPQRPYHKASSCPSKPKKCGWKEKNSENANPQPLYGALVSGPNILDEFKDDRSDFQHSAVGLTNNAGFTGLVAGIYDLELDGIMLEDKVAGAIGDTAVGKELFKMGTFAPDWGELIGASLLFYEAQRSGKISSNSRVPWRGDAALNDLGENGEDLSGGYFDAGDFMKFNFPMTWSMTVLAWGGYQYKDAYLESGQMKHLIDALKHATDYILACHTEKFKLYGQIGIGKIDHNRWGRPEDITWKRPAFFISEEKPGSELAAGAAATLASASMILRDQYPDYAKKLLSHARDLYEFADRFRDYYHRSIPDAENYYKSTGYGDELTWAGLWLYYASNDVWFLKDAEKKYDEFGLGEVEPFSFFWDDVSVGVNVLMAQFSSTKKAQAIAQIEAFCTRNLEKTRKVPYTPLGLLFVHEWAPLRYAMNTAFICGIVADMGINECAYREMAKSQVDYVLGKEVRSFVVGYGNNPPTRPHHRASSCPKRPRPCGLNEKAASGPNPQVLFGALVGGPDQTDRFYDDRGNYKQSEVALDFNAGFQGAMAAQLHLEMDPPPVCVTTTTSTTTTTVSTTPTAAATAAATRTPEPNINDVLENQMVFDEERGWIIQTNVVESAGNSNDYTSNYADYLSILNGAFGEYEEEDPCNPLLSDEISSVVEDYYYNPFPELTNKVVGQGDDPCAPKQPEQSLNAPPRGYNPSQQSSDPEMQKILQRIERIKKGLDPDPETGPTQPTAVIISNPDPPVINTLAPPSGVNQLAPTKMTMAPTPYKPPTKLYKTESPTLLDSDSNPYATKKSTTTSTTSTTMSTTTTMTKTKTTKARKDKPKKPRPTRLTLKTGIPTDNKKKPTSKPSADTEDSTMAGREMDEFIATTVETHYITNCTVEEMKKVLEMCVTKSGENLDDSCRYTTFKKCVNALAGYCDERWNVFRYWNKDRSNQQRFSYDEMICPTEAILAGDEFCPPTIIIDELETCMLQLAAEKLQPPSESKGPFVKCDFTLFQRCVNMRIGHCHKTWEIWQQWNVDQDHDKQFSLIDQRCEEEQVSSYRTLHIYTMLLSVLLLI